MKILVIGIDGAPPDFVFKWAKEGYLPNIKKLMDSGSYGRLCSTIPPHSGPAWSSFMTGVNPGKHGIYDFYRFRQDSRNVDGIEVITTADRKMKTLWRILSDYGKKVGIINVPQTYPVERVNGIIVSGFLTPGEHVEFTYPKELKKELLKRFNYSINLSDAVYNDAENKDMFIKEVLEITEKRWRTTKYLMKKYNWDFFMTVFTESDRIQHFFWKYMDKNHPAYEENERYGSFIKEYYQTLDKYIGNIIRTAGEDTITMIMSDHGQKGNYKTFNVNDFLIKIGMLKLKKSKKVKTKVISREDIRDLMLRLGLENIKNRLPQKLKDVVKRKLPSKFIRISNCDWERTKAYSFGFGGGIFINLKGRQPYGIVTPEEYESVVEQIKNELREVRDPENGNPIVEKVYKKEELYSGPYLSDAPDLVFLLKNSYTPSTYIQGRILSTVKSGRSGNHSLYGILICSGEGISHGEVKANIMDIAPTILHMFGLPIPKYMDGRVLTEIFRPGSEFAKRKVRYTSYEKEILRGRVKRLRAKRKI